MKNGDLVRTVYGEPDSDPYQITSDPDPDGWVWVRRPDGSEREWHVSQLVAAY